MTSFQSAGPDTERAAKVLVVDDNEQNLELLLAYMEDLPGVTLLSASDGEEALRVVAKSHPDLILLDVMMPRMSGFEVCKRLKDNKKTREIPIVMVTALNEQADIEKGAESGCDDFLTKPVNRMELLTRVKSLLRIRELKTRLDRTMGLIGSPEGPVQQPDDE
jgi:CheY-like chemotaxis protein